MRKQICSVLIMGFILSIAVPVKADDYNLHKMSRAQLETMQDDINSVMKLHHKADSDIKEKVQKVVKTETESYYAKFDCEVEWAWVDYEYTCDWDFVTLSTHLDFKDKKGKSKRADIYAELFADGNDYKIYYLLAGTELVINKREELPENLWENLPESKRVNSSGLDLSVMTTDELEVLEENIENELEKNHSTSSKINDILLDLVKDEVEKEYAETDWPWLDYDYTCDWGLYTLQTSVEYNDNDDEKEADIYAEAYPVNDEYELFYLTVGDNILIDKRNELPEELLAEEENAIIDISEERIIENTGVEKEVIITNVIKDDAKTKRELPSEEKKTKTQEVIDETIKEIEQPVNVEEKNEETEIQLQDTVLYKKGAKGEVVRNVQKKLIKLGYLFGEADGDFGEITQAALKKFQQENEIEENGDITSITIDKLNQKYYAGKKVALTDSIKENKENFLEADIAQYEAGGLADKDVYLRGNILLVTGYDDIMVLNNNGDVWHMELETSFDLSVYEGTECEVFGRIYANTHLDEKPPHMYFTSEDYGIRFNDGLITTSVADEGKFIYPPGITQTEHEKEMRSEETGIQNNSSFHIPKEKEHVTVPSVSEDDIKNPVWVPVNGGTKYHRKSGCSNMKNAKKVSMETAKANGYTPCKRCY